MRVILGPGLAPGLAGMGVLTELEARHVVVDEVIGVNTGALVAALWATQKDLHRMADVLSHLPWEKFFVATSLGEADPLLQTIQLLTQRATFKDVSRQMAVVARRRNTLQCELIQEGSVALAVRGSMAIPGIFHPIGAGDRDCVDAGTAWRQPIITTLDDPYQKAVWVVPEYMKIAAMGPAVPQSEQWASYVGLNWSGLDERDDSRLIQVERVGDMLSFDKSSEWMAAGKEATQNWWSGAKETFG